MFSFSSQFQTSICESGDVGIHGGFTNDSLKYTQFIRARDLSRPYELSPTDIWIRVYFKQTYIKRTKFYRIFASYTGPLVNSEPIFLLRKLDESSSDLPTFDFKYFCN